MLNKLLKFMRQYEMVAPGDHVICAVSGGADSVALLFSMYLLKDKLGIQLSAAHFNHRLRMEESDRDEAFVRAFCSRYDIPLFVGAADVKPGKKGLEAAARDARYGYLRQLPGKIATAHTADDNAETVLLHLVRGTGLKGLGGITPVTGQVIRPMLTCTRQNVEDFLQEWNLCHITDSSNDSDAFLRNRLRHHVMPLLKEENPKLAENMSAMALRLRQDEDCLSSMIPHGTLSCDELKKMHPSLRSRTLEAFLKENGVREPEAAHIAQAEALVFSEKPSVCARFPGGVTIARNYDVLQVSFSNRKLERTLLPCPGSLELPDWGLTITCTPAVEIKNSPNVFTVLPKGELTLRGREPGDSIRLTGGTRTLKKLFIDKKIPANKRPGIPVIADESGIVGIYGIGVNLDRAADQLPAVQIHIEEK